MKASVAPRFTGLTWDHPRGTEALRAASGKDLGGDLIHWDAQPLEGFESAPIAELASRYDLLVLDHPHLGDALASESLQPLDAVFPADLLAQVSAHSVGPSYASYEAEGHLWALPLDAATQVAAAREELVPVVPQTWAEVLELSESHPVALSLAGPHAFLSFCSLAAALGGAPRSLPARPTLESLDGVAHPLFQRDVAIDALSMLKTLASRVPDGSETLNPIALLERMRSSDEISYIPLIYGYVNYSAADVGEIGQVLRFCDAPVVQLGGPVGSTIGGTGIAVSARANVTSELINHLSSLLSHDGQEVLIPDHEGQPSRDSAWDNAEVNARFGNFYRNTRNTIEGSWVRPRFPGYTTFQSEASALLRQALLSAEFDPDDLLDLVELAYQRALALAMTYISMGARQ